uniref:Replication-associated protein ORF2/G2P domain-containing protein n=1 Tax=uncultured prokaryote TaxID=198431 RepID=A0A0H5Q5R0_9ZZZZ|nr:hypothetical protein [uncultured prokaryote]
MPILQAYANGLTMGTAGRNDAPVPRGKITGWTQAAVRRHTRWLYSIASADLDGYGYALTLTLRDTPPSALEWQAARRAWIERLRRRGMVRLHWVVEWQRRGTPHMHVAVYFPKPLTAVQQQVLLLDWLAVAAAWKPGSTGQCVKEITGPLGWLQYLSKHAARGVKHYQRAGKPAGWETTGRLWGHLGEWPAVEPIRAEISKTEYHRFRRLVRSWRVADARAHGLATGDWRRLTYARRMLSCSDPALSTVRGVSEWISDDLAMVLLDAAADRPMGLAEAA